MKVRTTGNEVIFTHQEQTGRILIQKIDLNNAVEDKRGKSGDIKEEMIFQCIFSGTFVSEDDMLLTF